MPRWSPDGLKPIKKKNVTGLVSYSFNAAEGLDLTVYKSIIFELEGVRTATDGGDVWLRTSGDSGASDYNVAGQIWIHNSTFIANSSNQGGTKIGLTPGSMGSVAANELGISGEIRLVNGGSALHQPLLEWDICYRSSDGTMFKHIASGYRNSQTQITSVDFLTHDGALFEQGEISIYGLRRIA